MVARGDARFITKDEMLGFLDKAVREGLVLEPENTQDSIFVRCCCVCCGGVPTAARKLPRPAWHFATNCHAVLDAPARDGCLICEDRCQMEAVACDGGEETAVDPRSR